MSRPLTLSSLIQVTGFLLKRWNFPQNPFIPAWSLSKSLLCLLLHPGLNPFLFTWKQWWCHCYINRGLLCSVFQPGLWVNGMACLVIQTCFWKKSGMSPNTTWLVLKRKEYSPLEKCGTVSGILYSTTSLVCNVTAKYRNSFSNVNATKHLLFN